MWEYISEILCTLFFLFFVRIFIVYLRIHKPHKVLSRATSPTSKVMIVLGSGGHTFEMFRLIAKLNDRYRPRIYVVAEFDEMSMKKAITFETTASISAEQEESGKYEIETIPRSREVLQSWFSSVFTTAYSCLRSLYVLYKHMPDMILCNGPGTCVPICFLAFLFHVLGIKHIKSIYIESICRVETLSLSGKILYRIVDYFFVQWPQLKKKYPRSRSFGRLI